MHIIITGGSGGIGRVIATRFLEEGAEVLLVGRSVQELEETRKEFSVHSGSVHIFAGDVSGAADVRAMIVALPASWKGTVDVLINAAGMYGPKGPLETIDEDEWIQTVSVNLIGTMRVTRAVLPLMKKMRRGVIINFSGGGEGAFPYFTAYAASKGGVVRFTESVAEEVKEWGIRVNAIAPGAVNTQLLDEALAAGPEKVGKRFYAELQKQKKEGGVSPEKAAVLCSFLASDRSHGLTGRVLSAVWDNLEEILRHIPEIMGSDIYTYRRIKPKDRGYEWK